MSILLLDGVALLLQGATNGASTASGALSTVKAMAGVVDGLAGTSGALAITKPLAGSVGAVSTATGSLTGGSVVGVHLLQGVIGGVSVVSGSLTVEDIHSQILNLVTKLSFLEKWVKNKWIESPDGRSMTLYEDDGVTPLGTWTLDPNSKTRGRMN